MAYFSNIDEHGNGLPIDYACVYEDIFINGLKDGEFLYSHQPHFLMLGNGRIVGINESFRNFYVIDEQRVVLQKLTLMWNEDCLENQERSLSQKPIMNASALASEAGVSSFLMIMLILLTLRRLYGS
jgi:hypothetical protein